MPALAIALTAAYLLVAFALRVAIQRLRTGDSGVRLHADRVGTPEWWARLGFVAALVLGAAAPVLALLGWLELVPALDRPAVAIAGVVLAGAAVVGVFAAQLAMGASWRIGQDRDERTDLVERWPFTVVRNPIFTTMAVAAVGIVLVAPTWLGLVAAALLVASLELQVRVVEEPHLRATHGASYQGYAARVGRFVPGVGKLDLR